MCELAYCDWCAIKVSLVIAESEFTVKKLAGDEKGGYSDGESGSARFNKPRSFAVDLKGNVYVADKTNRAIRKISNSGLRCCCFCLILINYLKLKPILNFYLFIGYVWNCVCMYVNKCDYITRWTRFNRV